MPSLTRLINQLNRATADQFLKPEVLGPWNFYEVDSGNGTYYVPVDVVGIDEDELMAQINSDDEHVSLAAKTTLIQYTEITRADGVYEVTLHRNVYGYRFSAPGYLDCTDWGIAKSRTGALKALIEEQRMYTE